MSGETKQFLFFWGMMAEYSGNILFLVFISYLTAFSFGCFNRFWNKKIYRYLILILLIFIPICIGVGIYIAAQPTA